MESKINASFKNSNKAYIAANYHSIVHIGAYKHTGERDNITGEIKIVGNYFGQIFSISNWGLPQPKVER